MHDISLSQEESASKWGRVLIASDQFSFTPLRDRAIILTMYATTCHGRDLAQIKVEDYMRRDGTIRETTEFVSAWSNTNSIVTWRADQIVTNAIDKYLEWRLKQNHGVNQKKMEYRGLNPKTALFLSPKGGQWCSFRSSSYTVALELLLA
jgi:site-specific recombinase XerD